MMKKWGTFCYVVFCVLFLAVPGVALLGSARFLVSSGILVSGAVLSLFFFAVLGAVFFLPRMEKVPSGVHLAVVMGVSVAFRYLCWKAIGDHMVMLYDYKTALESAMGAYAAKEAIFTHWAFYPRILRLWFAIFGAGYPQAVAFSIAVGACSVGLVWLIAKELWHSKKLATVAGLILALWPSLGLYHTVTSNEHLAMLTMLLGIYFLLLFVKGKKTDWKSWVFCILAGAFAGSSDLFKAFSPIFLVAFLLVGGVRWCKEGGGAKKLGSLLLAFVVLAASGTAVKSAAYGYLEQDLGQEICRSSTAHFFYIGLNSQSQGVWSEETGMQVYRLAEKYNNDYDKVMEELWQLLREDLEANPEALPGTILHKMKIDWAADSGVVDWIMWLYDGGAGTLPHAQMIYLVSASYYIALIGWLAMGALFAFVQGKKEQDGAFFLRLLVFGFAFALVFSEAQGRYQMVLFPIFALLAAHGAGQMPGLFRKKA